MSGSEAPGGSMERLRQLESRYDDEMARLSAQRAENKRRREERRRRLMQDVAEVDSLEQRLGSPARPARANPTAATATASPSRVVDFSSSATRDLLQSLTSAEPAAAASPESAAIAEGRRRRAEAQEREARQNREEEEARLAQARRQREEEEALAEAARRDRLEEQARLAEEARRHDAELARARAKAEEEQRAKEVAWEAEQAKKRDEERAAEARREAALAEQRRREVEEKAERARRAEEQRRAEEEARAAEEAERLRRQRAAEEEALIEAARQQQREIEERRAAEERRLLQLEAERRAKEQELRERRRADLQHEKERALAAEQEQARRVREEEARRAEEARREEQERVRRAKVEEVEAGLAAKRRAREERERELQAQEAAARQQRLEALELQKAAELERLKQLREEEEARASQRRRREEEDRAAARRATTSRPTEAATPAPAPAAAAAAAAAAGSGPETVAAPAADADTLYAQSYEERVAARKARRALRRQESLARRLGAKAAAATTAPTTVSAPVKALEPEAAAPAASVPQTAVASRPVHVFENSSGASTTDVEDREPEPAVSAARPVLHLENTMGETDDWDLATSTIAAQSTGVLKSQAVMDKRRLGGARQHRRQRARPHYSRPERTAIAEEYHASASSSSCDEGAGEDRAPRQPIQPAAEPVAVQASQPASQRAKAERLAKAANQSRGQGAKDYAGHSLAWVLNHETEALSQNLKSTGAKLTASGVPKLNRVHKGQREQALFHLKGKRHVRMYRVPMACASMNSGDAFVLDAIDCIFLWEGAGSGRVERAKAQAVAIDMKQNMYGGRVPICKLKEGDTGGDARRFFDLLDGSAAETLPAEACPDDAEYEDICDSATQLFEVGEHGALEIFHGKGLKRDMMGEAGVYVLRSKDEVFLWLSRKAPPAPKQMGQAQAEKIADNCHATWGVRTERQGKESTLFKEKFFLWPEHQASLAVKAQTGIKPRWNMPQPAKAPPPDEADLSRARYSEADLRELIKSGSLPADVDPTLPELSMLVSDFEKLFEMPRAAFLALPKWKRTQLRKEVGLF